MTTLEWLQQIIEGVKTGDISLDNIQGTPCVNYQQFAELRTDKIFSVPDRPTTNIEISFVFNTTERTRELISSMYDIR